MPRSRRSCIRCCGAPMPCHCVALSRGGLDRSRDQQPSTARYSPCCARSGLPALDGALGRGLPDMATGPSVSIVIPARGRPAHLVRAVESCLVSPRSGGAEVIVVVDGGDKPPRELGELGGLKVIELAVANANADRNVALAATRGEYVRFLDDDDD